MGEGVLMSELITLEEGLLNFCSMENVSWQIDTYEDLSI